MSNILTRAKKKKEKNNDKYKKKPITKKQIIVWLIIGSIGFVFLIWAAWGTYRFYHPKGYKTPEDLASAAIEATYADDIETLIGMFPYEIRTALYNDAATYNGANLDDLETTNQLFHKSMEEYHVHLNSRYGEGNWNVKYEVSDFYQYTEEEKLTVKQIFNRCGIDRDYKINEYGLVNVLVHVTSKTAPDYMEVTEHNIYIPALKQGHSWYLAQYAGEYSDEVTEKVTDVYGKLFNGLYLKNYLDEYGYMILDTEDGTSVRWNPEYKSYTYEDEYGNIHLCTSNYVDTKVIGPDGGEPLTEENYEEWWNNYYINLYGEDYFNDENHDHEQDDFEEFILFDDEEN